MADHPPCDCGVVPHRVWCQVKPAYDAAYPRIVTKHYEALEHGPRGFYRPHADRVTRMYPQPVEGPEGAQETPQSAPHAA